MKYHGPKRVVKSRFGGVWLKVTCALLLLFLIVVVAHGEIATAQTANPWDTPAGQVCFERWISESMAKLNAYDGGSEFNGRKPWSINRYGVLEGNPQFGPRSVAAPDNFPQYDYNKYWWMWDQYIPTGPLGTWRWPEWNGAGVAPLRPFVLSCIAASAGTSGGGSSTEGGRPASGGGTTRKTRSGWPDQAAGNAARAPGGSRGGAVRHASEGPGGAPGQAPGDGDGLGQARRPSSCGGSGDHSTD